MKALIFAAVLLLCVGGSAAEQDLSEVFTRLDSVEQQLQDKQGQIDELKARVDRCEAANETTAAVVSGLQEVVTGMQAVLQECADGTATFADYIKGAASRLGGHAWQGEADPALDARTPVQGDKRLSPDMHPEPEPPPHPPQPPQPQPDPKTDSNGTAAGPDSKTCGCDADFTRVKTDYRALKLRADKTESKVADLFASVLARETNAALFGKAIGGRRRVSSSSSSSSASRLGRLLAGADLSDPTQLQELFAAVMIELEQLEKAANRRKLQRMDGAAGTAAQGPGSYGLVHIFMRTVSSAHSIDPSDGGGGGGGHRILAEGGGPADCSRSAITEQIAAISVECCDEPGEECYNGQVQTCNAGCGALITPFWTACQTELTQDVAEMLQDAVTLCPPPDVQVNSMQAQMFMVMCPAGLPADDCIPLCEEETHGFLLLLNIDGTDTTLTCSLSNLLFSWVGAAALGGYIGSDVKAFLSAVLSGASGT
eukprot:SAG22_NODE_1659_length_3873_cov_11.321940_1_plen_483_part_10